MLQRLFLMPVCDAARYRGALRSQYFDRRKSKGTRSLQIAITSSNVSCPHYERERTPVLDDDTRILPVPPPFNDFSSSYTLTIDHQAKKLDRAIAETTTEAAHGHNFTDDNCGYADNGRREGELRSLITGYSDTTHSTTALGTELQHRQPLIIDR
ncbi:hypothetical protein A0H81_14965 [Grifola frondosa]|uniref:Uncharacterized protein n=1 Tax=Grifola frondosa TaxID=5627 RepID=A0A1C7LJR5_GRIFR|nr:hypothetical protein A0H81_14965 [Grifola frondosa]